MPRPLSFERAKALYVNRFTAEHKPAWANERALNGKFYAPQFSSDREWYEHTLFHGESDMADRRHCYTSGQTWPLGHWLNEPFTPKGGEAHAYRS
jgi:hypothetical protein